MLNKYRNLIFLTLILAVSFYYDYHNIIFKPTQGIHQWRQTDGASIALNYYMEGMHFFQPQTHNLTSDNGTTSFNATGDAPLLYYSVAILYKIFGFHEFLYRLLNTLIFLLGLFYLFKAFMLIFKDFTWAASIALLGFASPVLAYYGSNFIPDSTALAISFIALYHFFNYYELGKKRNLILMLFFFFLAGSLKITALISFGAIGLLFLLEWTGILKSTRRNIFLHRGLFIIGSIVSIGLVLSWVFYASWFNSLHESSYFSTTIFPIWQMDKEGIQKVLRGIRITWLSEYYHFSVYILSGISLLAFMLFYRKMANIFKVIIPAVLFFGIAFFFMQFFLLKDHDYYMINLFVIPVLLIAGVIAGFQKDYPEKFKSVYSKTLFILFLLFNIYYSEKSLNERYNGLTNQTELRNNDFYDIKPVLREIGLDRNTRVISIPGGSHINLYLMDQKGWTEFTDHKLYKAESYKYNRDKAGIRKSINNGAEYLILGNIDQLFLKPFLREFATHLSGRHKNALIFDLKNPVENFSLENKTVRRKIICDAEITDSSGKFYLSRDSVNYFENAETQSTEKSFAGEYSSRLDKNHNYGMTITIDSLKKGESFQVSVWKSGQHNIGSIEIAAEDRKDFYLSIPLDPATSDVNSDWNRIETEFFVPLQLEGKKLKFFLFNPNEEPVYFDNFEILHFKSILE